MNIITSTISKIAGAISRYQWKPTNTLTTNEQHTIREMLKTDYYIILSRRNNHLSTYAISLGHFLLTGKWGYWSHAFMNLEDEVKSDKDFRIIEAVGTGVKYTPFKSVFDVNSVVLLKPKSMLASEWTGVLDKAKTELGKPYDTLFDLSNDKALSCVELVRVALMNEPAYSTDFVNFEKMISDKSNLTPDMFYNCSDFEVVFEIKH